MSHNATDTPKADALSGADSRSWDCGGGPEAASVAESGLDAIASQVISMVAKRVAGGKTGVDLRSDCLELLCAAAACDEGADRRAYLRRIQDLGATPEDIVDIYIPEVARRLGADWEEDRRTFADVTIGTARLQAMVRELDRSWEVEQATNSRAPNILMVVQDQNYHTLGAMIASCRFRRLGVSVHMLLGKPDREVVVALKSGRFDMVSVSLSTMDRVESVRKLVRLLRGSDQRQVPIVVGGPVCLTPDDVRKFTGADHFTLDCAEALSLCGLAGTKSGSAAHRVRG